MEQIWGVRKEGPQGLVIAFGGACHDGGRPNKDTPRMQWLRLWHEMPNDPKWRTIAKQSQCSIADVIAVAVHILVEASANATERGRTQPNATEHIASALDMEVGFIVRIKEAMQGRFLDGDRVINWDKRQPKREDGSAERGKLWREKQKTERNRTQPNATERPEKNRTEKPLTPNRSAQPTPPSRKGGGVVDRRPEVRHKESQSFGEIIAGLRKKDATDGPGTDAPRATTAAPAGG